MKKTKVLSLLLAVFLLLSSLTLPLLAVDAETAEDPEQTQSDGADAETVTTSDKLPFSSASRQVMIFVRLAG